MKKPIWFFFYTFLLLVFTKETFAAITITDVSPATVNSQDDVVSITANATGLSNSTQYLQVLFTKEGDSTNYFGLTQNQQGEWYQYKSSPSLTNDLQIYFYSFVPVGGSWTGTVSAKLNTDDSGYKGTGNYILKLAKYITSSSPTYSTNQYTIVSNIATPTPTDRPTPTALPTTVSMDLGLISSAESVLGSSETSIKPSETAKSQTKTLSVKEDITPKIFIILGVFTIIVSAGLWIARRWIKL